jgi:hypothetical protein
MPVDVDVVAFARVPVDVDMVALGIVRGIRFGVFTGVAPAIERIPIVTGKALLAAVRGRCF